MGLMRPYHDTGHLTNTQKTFNFKLSSTRMIVENANGRLKGKWRRLKHIETKTIDKAKSIIIACLVLHNFILRYDSNLTIPIENHNFVTPVFASAEDKRDFIASYLQRVQ